MKLMRRIAGASLMITAGLVLALNASGQKPKVMKKPVPKPTIQLKLKTLPASAKLKQAIKGKKLYSAAKLSGALSYTPQKQPKLRLAKGGRQIVLERVDVPEPQPSAQLKVAAAKLEPTIAKYKTYVQAPYFKFEKPLHPVFPPASVDHRTRQTSIKDQGGRGTCVAHAAMAGIESWYKWKNNVNRDLSEQHAFEIFMAKEGKKSCWDQGIQTWKAAGYLTTDRVCSNWAYTTALPPCNVAIPTSCANAATNGHVSTQVVFGTEFGGTGTTTANNTNYLETILATGNDIVFGVYVAGTDWSDNTLDNGVIDVQTNANGTPAAAYAGHALLMVGYNRAGNYFELKNSWGAGSGHQGYARLSYEYVQTYGKYGYYITAATNP